MNLSALRLQEQTLSRELKAVRKKLRATAKRERRATSRGLGDGLRAYNRDRDECDLLMARIVKAEVGHCEACPEMRRDRLQWCHGLSRRFRSTRWTRENSFCLCSACHLRFTYDAPAWADFMIAGLGEDGYRQLVMLSRLKLRHNGTLVVALRARASELGVLTDEGWKDWLEGRT